MLVASRANYETNKYDGELLSIDVASGARRNLAPSRKSVWSPQWSPKGDQLAFLAPGDSGTAQVWLLPVQGGEAAVLTSAKRGVRQFAWRPDGGAIAYVAEDEPAVLPRYNGAKP